jgi:hypothetical protein
VTYLLSNLFVFVITFKFVGWFLGSIVHFSYNKVFLFQSFFGLKKHTYSTRNPTGFPLICVRRDLSPRWFNPCNAHGWGSFSGPTWLLRCTHYGLKRVKTPHSVNWNWAKLSGQSTLRRYCRLGGCGRVCGIQDVGPQLESQVRFLQERLYRLEALSHFEETRRVTLLTWGSESLHLTETHSLFTTEGFCVRLYIPVNQHNRST